ncbi:hypothetical protein MNBD_ALPHA06-1761 [hydrothermal vent metagenome]|uniref:ASPIC/UnbV domain-containing protein n=1 Tax=hydrothermal vent metagenome TaxID=652676 RepID=A0A3B0RCH1_9ZZZZ
MHKGLHLTLRICLITSITVFIGWAVVALLLPLFGLQIWQQEWKSQGKTDLRFERVVLDFTNTADLERSLPFMASAAIDVDADGQDEVFLGGGRGQLDGLFRFENGSFVDISEQWLPAKSKNDASMGAAKIDLNADGKAELFVARESGLWLYKNNGTGFESVFLGAMPEANTVALSIALGDVNGDGFVDFYASGYIRNELVEGTTIFNEPYGGYSALFLNTGENNWVDATKSAGLYRQHNTFSAVFVDLDNDLDSDLVIAQDTGKVEMYANDGTGKFQPIENPSVFSYPMGVAAGDYDNDGLMDLYFSNVGHTMPAPMVRGDLTKEQAFNSDYMLFHNDGELRFSDTARTQNAARYGFGWGVVFADMDLDGKEDLLAAQNYARFPDFLSITYPGKILLQDQKGEFHPVEKRVKAKNDNYGITPLVSDFNGDGWPDLVWVNLAGPSLAYLSKGGDNHWLKVRLPDQANSINAIVQVQLPDETWLTKQRIYGQGLGSDQSRDLIFGLGANTAIKQIRVRFQDGRDYTVDAPGIDRTLTLGGN